MAPTWAFGGLTAQQHRTPPAERSGSRISTGSSPDSADGLNRLDEQHRTTTNKYERPTTINTYCQPPLHSNDKLKERASKSSMNPV
jgi:hypothetical protein